MFHQEGFKTIMFTTVLIALSIISIDTYIHTDWLRILIQLSVLSLFLVVLQFFRNPKRETLIKDNHIIAPIDGKIIGIKEVEDASLFESKRLQISIKNSFFDNHILRYPISGEIIGVDQNNSVTTIKSKKFNDVILKQINSKEGHQFINYAKHKELVVQGIDLSFVKFGTEVHLLLPLSTNLTVSLGDKIKGGEQIIATL